MCNFLEYKGDLNTLLMSGLSLIRKFMLDSKVVYRRYASLFFVCGIGSGDNELVTLEIIHRYVEVLDRYFGNVSYIWSPSFLRSLQLFNSRFASLTCKLLVTIA